MIGSTQAFGQEGLANRVVAGPGFPLVDGDHVVPLVYDPEDFAVVKVAVESLSADLESVGGLPPELVHDPCGLCSCVIIGTLGKSRWLEAIAEHGAVPELRKLNGLWEGYLLKVVEDPLPGVGRVLLIAGSDRRGTAFGVYQMSQYIGVSPWYWWAEVPVPKRDKVVIPADLFILEKPAVRYRGWFINDEIFGFGPWAKETFDPGHPEAIGPRAYEKVFELMLRLRMNYLWPAIKKGYGPFSHYPENRELADRYAIVVGSQHSEPLTMYGPEWDPDKHGEWDYFTNKAGILEFLESRVAENKRFENVYTMGLRGIDDVSMQGNPTVPEQAAVLEEVLGEMRSILSRQLEGPVSQVPQSLVLYKEVLKAWDYGFEVPEDITLVWTDDNYGYMKRLPEAADKDRAGGHGLYYHLSYLGRPFDYLWLGGMNGHLMLSELKKAHRFGVERIWVFNVGDIKPLEYDLSLAADIAWNPHSLSHENLAEWQRAFFAGNFSGQPELAAHMAHLRHGYDQLALLRRPEHMAWSRLEQVRISAESEFSWIHGREAEQHLADWMKLEAASEEVLSNLPQVMQDAYWHLLHYRVVGAAQMVRKWLLMSRYAWHMRQGRALAFASYEQAWDAFRKAWSATDHYTGIKNGKWERFNGLFPFDVYGEPYFREPQEERRWIRPEPFEQQMRPPLLSDLVDPAVWVEGDQEKRGGGDMPMRSPVLSCIGKSDTFLEIYNHGTASFKWQAQVDVPWILLSRTAGDWTLDADVRLRVVLLTEHLPEINSAGENLSGCIRIHVGNWQQVIQVPVFHPRLPVDIREGDFIEDAGLVSLPATAFSAKRESETVSWSIIEGIGSGGKVVTATPADARRYPDDWNVKRDNPYLEYRFFTFNRGWMDVEVSTLPTFPANKERHCIFAIALNDDAEIICDFSSYQRDERWMQGVERNRTTTRTRHFVRAPGWQTLRLYMCDPGVCFDHILVDFGRAPDTYLPPPPTRVPVAGS